MKLTFWFDVHSPWCYLASFRIGELARRHRLDLAWVPIHLPSLSKAIDGRRPLEANPAFVAWYKQDAADWAELQGLPLRYHPHYPLRNSRLLRCCQYAADHGRAEEFVQAAMSGYWAHAADITDLSVIAGWAKAAGLPEQDVSAAALSDVYKQRIQENTQAAKDRGVFGVPTTDTGNKLYFGNDRLDLLDTHLKRMTAKGAANQFFSR